MPEPPPPPPSPAYVPASYPPPAPPPPEAGPATPAPAPGAVAVLERDRAEFPGQPLPDGFFAALPERTRRAPRKLNVRVLVLVAVVGGGALFSAIGEVSDRNAAVDSPARYLLEGACGDYRDFTTRLDRDGDDQDALADGMVWFANNGDRFMEAARLDPELQPAADFVVWFNGVIEADFEPIADMSPSEIDDREQALTEACYSGPGRA